MEPITHDTRRGIAVLLLASVAFGFSGTFARPLLDGGWSAAGLVTARVFTAAAFLAVPAVLALRRAPGRPLDLLRRDLGLLLGYGLIVVAFTQVSYFKAAAQMDVAIALLVQFAAPVVVLGWLRVRHGQRHSRTTLLGAVVAMLGMGLVIDVFGGLGASAAGVLWALGAMVGLAFYFVLSARPSHLPAITLAAGGMLLAGFVLLALGGLGFLEFHASTSDAVFRGVEVPFWLALIGLGGIATAASYSLGIIGTRLAGVRLGSFISLFEVLTALVVSWALLGQRPGLVQAIGGVGILAGVVLVKLGERDPGYGVSRVTPSRVAAAPAPAPRGDHVADGLGHVGDRSCA